MITDLFLRSRKTTLDDAERTRLDAAISEIRTYGRRSTVSRHHTSLDVSLYLIRGVPHHRQQPGRPAARLDPDPR